MSDRSPKSNPEWSHQKRPLSIRAYQAFSHLAGPFARIALRQRLSAGKEDPNRISERRGIAARPRPHGKIFWIHAVSVGESLSILPLINLIEDYRDDFTFLVTTGTVTSAQIMATRLPATAIHQYIPIDHPHYVSAFLDHWRPDAAVFIESELWPNLILAAKESIPFMTLLNARISPRSFKNWSKHKKHIQYIFSAFDALIAQDKVNAGRISFLSGRPVATIGNLKNAAAPLPIDQDKFDVLKKQIDGRHVWLASSTHPGEEYAIVKTHQLLKNIFPDILTIIAPRHAERGAKIQTHARELALKTCLRSTQDPPTNETDIYIADTLGELGLFYQFCDIAFVGGSLDANGGHNPLEAAHLECAILHGPHIFNFDETYEGLHNIDAAVLVTNERDLATSVQRLLNEPNAKSEMIQQAKSMAQTNADKILRDLYDLVVAKLPKEKIKS